jgi:LemA protein
MVAAPHAQRMGLHCARRANAGRDVADGQPDAAVAGGLGRLFALAEAYPDLKANTNMLSLQEELSSTENKLSFARQAYNDAVMAYNTSTESFPSNLIAGAFGFSPSQMLQATTSAQEREPVKVQF